MSPSSYSEDLIHQPSLLHLMQDSFERKESSRDSTSRPTTVGMPWLQSKQVRGSMSRQDLRSLIDEALDIMDGDSVAV